MSDSPIYDNVRLDLGIDPADQLGHDARVHALIEFSKRPRNTKIARKPPKRK